MAKLPKDIKLTLHARERLEERNNIHNCYNTKNLMRSSCKWYGKDDLIPQSALFIHCLYVCRKSKNKMGYLTDGNIEVLYDKEAGVAITIMEVKEKFKPITQYIKPSLIKEIENKKEIKKMRKTKTIIGICKDCEAETEIYENEGICKKCRTRKQNSRVRGKEYIPYKDLPEDKKHKIDNLQAAQAHRNNKDEIIEIPLPNMEVAENYYQVKAENNPAIAHLSEKSATQKIIDPLTNQNNFVTTLRDCGCEIPEENLKDILNVLVSTDKLKDLFMTIAKSENQKALLDLEQALNVVERKLQHDWEFNGFQQEDDMKFKNFLTWRRVLKGAIFFWKKLYQTNTIIEMQRAWNAYTQNPNDKILLAGDRIDSTMKRFQITTETISTILNTHRPFTRVFYATDKDIAYNMFVKWLADRQLHEDKSKTVIVELKTEGEDGRKNA